MREIYFVTINKGKMYSMRQILEPYDISIQHVNLELPELQSNNIDEIARDKAKRAFALLQQPVLVHDTAFCIGALKGFPGSYAKFVLNTIGLDGILKLVENRDRVCHFQHCLAYMDALLAEPMMFESDTVGYLSFTKSGLVQDYENWSSLFSIFMPIGYDKTLAEMKKDEYDRWTQTPNQSRYAKKFAEWFQTRKGEK